MLHVIQEERREGGGERREGRENRKEARTILRPALRHGLAHVLAHEETRRVENPQALILDIGGRTLRMQMANLEGGRREWKWREEGREGSRYKYSCSWLKAFLYI